MAKKKKKGSTQTLQEEIVEVCLRRGIVFPSAEIYGGAAGFYEFGPVGSALRQNLINLWRDMFINSEDNVYEIAGSLILPEKVFAASGHLDSFNDPMTQCKNCKSMFRVDHLILENLDLNVEGKSLDELKEIISGNNIVCSKCKGELSEPRDFNMMFETNIGSVGGVKGYLRPETAQNIFLNFKRISHSMRAKLPFGIAQVGKAFRNEISPRNFLVRLRELEQMEIEMFVDPDELNNHPSWEEIEELEVNMYSEEAQQSGKTPERMTIKDAVEKGIILNQYLAYYIAKEAEFVEALGIDQKQYWFRVLQTHERAHYSQANYDLEIQFPFGIVECIGLAYRTDYDLLKHQEHSKTKMHIDQDGKKVIPHVIEPSMGVDRLIYASLLSSYQKEGREWTWFKFANALAPWEVVVAPLMKKDGMAEAAKQIFWELKDMGVDTLYDQSGAIGRRYARSDEIGIPLVITLDYETLEKETVTIRERNSMEQIRVPVEELGGLIKEFTLDLTSWDDLVSEFGKIEKN
ncbi:MAG: glycine--tRNA ligase [Candidatus Heimdallarchaeota archaeon]|nr:glycine--tRNA ligase [Candidatus Heimdallarchaeota archaeon]